MGSLASAAVSGVPPTYCLAAPLYSTSCSASLGSPTRLLVFRPMDPPITVPVYFVTKKYQTFSPAVRLFLERIRTRVEQKDERA